MRITSGELRGRPIQAPPGQDTRPTSDRTRQAVFNILEHAAWSPGVDGARVLDLFAGSGAMGLEALSHGAAWCQFFDTAQPSLLAIRANVQAFRLDERCSILNRDAARLPRRPDTDPPYDLAFLDPPYGKGLGEAALEALKAGDWMGPDAILVLERAASEPELAASGYEVLDQRRYGVASVLFLSPRPALRGEGG